MSIKNLIPPSCRAKVESIQFWSTANVVRRLSSAIIKAASPFSYCKKRCMSINSCACLPLSRMLRPRLLTSQTEACIYSHVHKQKDKQFRIRTNSRCTISTIFTCAVKYFLTEFKVASCFPLQMRANCFKISFLSSCCKVRYKSQKTWAFR